MCNNDFYWNATVGKENLFCMHCHYFKEKYMGKTIFEYCSQYNIQWWCVHLKCANWEPYPDGKCAKELRIKDEKAFDQRQQNIATSKGK